MANSVEIKPTEGVNATEHDKHEEETGTINEDDCDLYDDIDQSTEVEQSGPSTKDKTSLSELFCSPVKEFETAPGARSEKTCPSNQKQTPRKTNGTPANVNEDVDLYDDLDNFDETVNVQELQERFKLLEEKYTCLEARNRELEAELATTQKKNVALRTNISSLYKTAKLEIERKERQLKEMQQKYDSMVFRRGSTGKGPQRPNNNVEKLSREFAQGKVFEVEKETECMIHMGNTSISFSVESEDFRKQRVERLTELTNKPAQVRQVLATPTLSSSKDAELEEGEVEEKEEPPATTTSPKGERQDRHPRKRSRSRERVQPPVRTTVVRSPSRRRRSPRVMPVKDVESKEKTPRKASYHRSRGNSPPRPVEKRASSTTRATLRRR